MFVYSDIPDNNTSYTLDALLNSIEFSINEQADNCGNRVFMTPHIHLTHDSTGSVPTVFCKVDCTCGFEWHHYLLSQYHNELETFGVKLKLDRQNYDPGGRLIHVPSLPDCMNSFANYVAMILNCVQEPVVIKVTAMQSTRYFYHNRRINANSEIIAARNALCALKFHLIEIGLESKLNDVLILMRHFRKVSSHKCRHRLPIQDAIRFLDETCIPSLSLVI